MQMRIKASPTHDHICPITQDFGFKMRKFVFIKIQFRARVNKKNTKYCICSKLQNRNEYYKNYLK